MTIKGEEFVIASDHHITNLGQKQPGGGANTKLITLRSRPPIAGREGSKPGFGVSIGSIAAAEFIDYLYFVGLANSV